MTANHYVVKLCLTDINKPPVLFAKDGLDLLVGAFFSQDEII